MSSILLPSLWLSLSAAWGVVIFVTDQPAWPLALWTAITLGPLVALGTRTETRPENER